LDVPPTGPSPASADAGPDNAVLAELAAARRRLWMTLIAILAFVVVATVVRLFQVPPYAWLTAGVVASGLVQVIWRVTDKAPRA